MYTESFWDRSAFVVRIQGERQKFAVLRIVGSIFLTACVETLVRHSLFIGGAVLLGGCFATYKICEVQYGISEMRVEENRIRFVRSIFGIKRSSSFPQSDVEKLGYLKESEREPSALGMMIRTLIMPFLFARGISPEEASKLLTEITSSGSWLASKALSVDRQLF